MKVLQACLKLKHFFLYKAAGDQVFSIHQKVQTEKVDFSLTLFA